MIEENDPDGLRRRLGDEIRREVLRIIREEGMELDDLARRLNIPPSGATILLNREPWPIDVALRMAQAFKVPVRVHASD